MVSVAFPNYIFLFKFHHENFRLLKSQHSFFEVFFTSDSPRNSFCKFGMLSNIGGGGLTAREVLPFYFFSFMHQEAKEGDKIRVMFFFATMNGLQTMI